MFLHSKPYPNETGWDLGPFAAVLQCLHLDTPLFQQQNTKKLHGTKNNCVDVQLGQILDKRYKETKKAQLSLLRSLEQKQGVTSKSRVLSMPPALNTTRGVGKPPKPHLQPDLWTHPYPHPI